MRGIEGAFPRSHASPSQWVQAPSPASASALRWRGRWEWRWPFPWSAFRTLTAFAAPLLSEPRTEIIAATIDARHGSVYFQLFEASGRPLGPPRCDTPRECVRAIGAGPAWFAGDAAALVASEAQRAGLPYDLDAARDSAGHCRSRSGWSRGRPFDQSRAPRLRKTARRAAKCGRAHRQGAGLNV